MNTRWSQRPVRAAGERPMVIGLHAGAGAPEQWWPLAAVERIARLLAGALPRAEWRRIDGADRMGPGAHPEAVDREIEKFLAQATGHRDPADDRSGRAVSRAGDVNGDGSRGARSGGAGRQGSAGGTRRGVQLVRVNRALPVEDETQ